MTLNQLRIFLAVAEREHITMAAKALRLTQSAVSDAIQALEFQHDLSLFQRIGRRIELSADGRAFIDYAQSTIRAAEAASRFLRERRGLEQGEISVYASQTTGSYWLPQRLARFHALHPKLEIKVRLGNTDDVINAIKFGHAEIGFVEGAVWQPDLGTEAVDSDQLVIVVASTHPWSSPKRAGRKQLLEADWVLRERGSGTRAVFEESMRSIGIDLQQLKVRLELPSNEAVRMAVESGAGATAISLLVVRAALRSKTLRQIKFAPIKRPFVLLHHPERVLSPAAKAFRHYILSGD